MLAQPRESTWPGLQATQVILASCPGQWLRQTTWGQGLELPLPTAAQEMQGGGGAPISTQVALCCRQNLFLAATAVPQAPAITPQLSLPI